MQPFSLRVCAVNSPITRLVDTVKIPQSKLCLPVFQLSAVRRCRANARTNLRSHASAKDQELSLMREKETCLEIGETR